MTISAVPVPSGPYLNIFHVSGVRPIRVFESVLLVEGIEVCTRWLEVGAFALAHVVNVERVRPWGKLRYRQSNPYAIRRLRKLRRATFFPRESAKSAFAVVAAFWATRTAAERNRTPRPDIKLFMALTPPPVFEFDDYRPGSALVQVCTSKFLTAARQ